MTRGASRRAEGALLIALASGVGCSAPITERPSPPLAPSSAADAVPFASELADVLPRIAGDGLSAPSIFGALLLEGEKSVTPVTIAEGDCGLFVAKGSKGVSDVDLFVFGEDGQILAADETSGELASVVVCPPHPRTAYAVVRAVAGAGAVGVAAANGKPEAVLAVAKKVGARGAGDDSGRLDSWPGLAAEIAQRRRALGGSWSDVRRSALPVDPRSVTRASVDVEAGRCVDVLVLPSDEVQSLELVASGGDDRFLARASNAGRERTLTLCSRDKETVNLSIRPRGSPGIVALVVIASQPGVAATISRSMRVDFATEPRRLDESARAFVEALPEGRRPREIFRGTAKVDRVASGKAELVAPCVRFDVVAGAPAGSLRASVWSSAGSLRGEGRGGSAVALFGCGDDKAARVEVVADVREGPFAVFARPVPDAPAVLASVPLAASRLLTRLHAEGIEPAFTGATTARVTLDETVRHRRAIKVGGGACVLLMAALDGKSTGLELTVDDGTTRRLVEEPSIASERMCAGASPIQVTVEARVLAGTGEALFYERGLQ